MQDNLYLIAHKVRGEPAFDIAMCCEDMGTATDPGPWWISATWGWRAYPFWTQKLDIEAGGMGTCYFDWDIPPMPEDATDIFEQSNDARKMTGADLAEGTSLLHQLGLIKPSTPINRRSL